MKKLSKDEMKKVVGGVEDLLESPGDGSGTCCFHNTGWSDFVCGISKELAQTMASNSGAGYKWCCASC